MQVVLMILILPFIVSITSCDQSKVVTTKSPDNKLSLEVSFSNGQWHYSVSADGNKLISQSSLGLDFGTTGLVPSKGWKVSRIGREKVDTVWKPVWGKDSIVRNQYNETIIELQGAQAPLDKIYLEIRAYNDGIAFRYKIPEDAKWRELSCKKELTTFHFADNYTAWFYNGEKANLGPVRLTKVAGNRRPVMTIQANSRAYMAILEANLITGSPMVLHSKEGETTFSVASSPGRIKPGYKSSWRVILFGEAPGVLVDSHIVQLLNPQPENHLDFSWVKPGVAVWDWRARGARVDGFEYESNFSSWIRMVDFASENGLSYLMLDGGWYGPEFKKESSPLRGNRVEAVKKIIAYAGTKNVRIWLYLNDIAVKRHSLEKILKQFDQWGVAGIKVGFMRGSAADRNRRTRMITKRCAAYHLMCDFHDGPVIPYGQMRTWPNAVTREYCHAQLDGHSLFSPETFVTAVYVNMLAGPLDMANGVFDLLRVRSNTFFKPLDKPAVPSTVTSEAARTLIVFSGLTVLPDIPENYEKFPALLSFIASERMPWTKSKTLAGQIGQYIVMARQAADGTWLVGAVTNASARKIDIPLNFLAGGKYEATMIQDGENAHYLTNRLAHKVVKMTVRSSDSIPVRLAPGGGACLIIKKK